MKFSVLKTEKRICVYLYIAWVCFRIATDVGTNNVQTHLRVYVASGSFPIRLKFMHEIFSSKNRKTYLCISVYSMGMLSYGHGRRNKQCSNAFAGILKKILIYDAKHRFSLLVITTLRARPTIIFFSLNFYSRKKCLYIAWACFRIATDVGTNNVQTHLRVY